MARAHPRPARLGASLPADARPPAAREKLTRILILADDLTGAADCAAAFLGRARQITVSLEPPHRNARGVLSFDLDTRSRSAKAAATVVRRAFASRAARDAGILFKKIDSTLRGHVAAELAAARASLGHSRPVILAPAFPSQQRVVRGGRVHVKGVPLAEKLRAGKGVLVPDCGSDADLDRVARAGLAMSPRPLFVGSAGLARAIARVLPRTAPAQRRPISPAPVITVVGSAAAVSVRQARCLSRHPALGKKDLLLQLEWTREPTVRDRPLVRNLGRLVAGHAPRAHYVLTGGETARSVLQALGVGEFRLLGEVEPGVPFGVSEGGTLICTKAGGFGSTATLARCVARLKREMKGR